MTTKLLTPKRLLRTAALGLIACAGLALAIGLSGSSSKAVAAGETFDATQKGQIEAIIKDYLLKNPEILVEVQRTLEQKQEVARNEATTKAVAANSASLFKNTSVPTAGAKDGDVKVVEFFDYNCIHCRDAVDILAS